MPAHREAPSTHRPSATSLPPIPPWVLVLSILLQLSSILRYVARDGFSGMGDPWFPQITAAVTFSLLCSIVGSFGKSPLFRTGVLALRVFVLTALTVPLSESIGGIKLPILLALYLEIGFGMPLYAGLAASMIVTFLLWGPLRFLLHWSFDSVPEVPIDLPQVLVYAGLLLGAAAAGRLSAGQGCRG